MALVRSSSECADGSQPSVNRTGRARQFNNFATQKTGVGQSFGERQAKEKKAASRRFEKTIL